MMRRRYAIAVVWVHEHAGCIQVRARLCTLNSMVTAGVILNGIATYISYIQNELFD